MRGILVLMAIVAAVWWMNKNQALPTFAQMRALIQKTPAPGGAAPSAPPGNLPAPTPTPAPTMKFSWNWKLTAGAVVLAAFLLWFFWGTIAGWMPGSTKDVLNQGLPTSITGKTWLGGIILGVTLGWLSDTKFSGVWKTIGSVLAWILLAICLWMTPVSVYEFFVGTRHPSVPQETSQSAATAPAAIAAITPSVIVPACGAGWSKAIPIPADLNVTSAWNMETVQAAWRENDEWKQFEGKYLSGSFDAVKYCAKKRSYAGKKMTLTWTQR